ncbi:hypothetical protein LTR41_011324 [Exophiala xenobiotica]|nr:hypothetical protein LTR41_011324 [Exophiala xenobiotica]
MARFGGFGRRGDAGADTGTTDYGAPAGRSSRAHRLAILANHWLHWSSSIIVLGISAYFIANYSHNTHLVYWITVACVDAFAYLPALVLPILGSYKGYMAPAAWVFSYLWLTAFIFAAQDYDFGGTCARSPSGVNKCSQKDTLQAFAFIAFFTNILGQFLEGWLWAMQPSKDRGATHADKSTASASTGATATPATTTGTGAV